MASLSGQLIAYIMTFKWHVCTLCVGGDFASDRCFGTVAVLVP